LNEKSLKCRVNKLYSLKGGAMLNWFIGIALLTLVFWRGALVNVQPANVPPPSVRFDRDIYYPGDTVTIFVFDFEYAWSTELVGKNILVLYDKDYGVIATWDRLEALPDQPDRFRATCVLPETVKLGNICAKYTNPYIPARTAMACAQVFSWCGPNVLKNVVPNPNPFFTSTTFILQGVPTGVKADRITITIYDLTGNKVAEIVGIDTAAVTWNGQGLKNGAYIYMAKVEGGGKVFGPFKGFVYIER
jgi:hypothetical protein